METHAQPQSQKHKHRHKYIHTNRERERERYKFGRAQEISCGEVLSALRDVLYRREEGQVVFLQK
jgi:hypothetical protein